jgi:guanylate kinase
MWNFIMKNKIFVFCGFSGCGKDTQTAMLSDYYGIDRIVSVTTRPKREGEIDGVTYHFISTGEFKKLIANDELIEYRTYNTLVNNEPDIWYYGVRKSDVQDDKPYVTILDLEGLKEFQEYFGRRVISFFLDVKHDVRKERVKARGDFDETEWQRRAADDANKFVLSELMHVVTYMCLCPEQIDKETIFEGYVKPVVNALL